jgi:hypothetical protein
VSVFHFLNLCNKICGTFRHICNSDEVLLHVLLRDLCEACKNRYVRSCFERRFHETNHPEALCFEGMERLMRRRNPGKGLKLIGDAVAGVPLQPYGPRSHGTAPGNQRRSVAP